MKLLNRLSVSVLAAILVLLTQSSVADQSAGYSPQLGDEAVIYTHRFNAQDYEAGKQLVIEGFSAAIVKAGQARHTYFLEDPQSHEIVAVSFFKKGHSVDEWHAHMARLEVLRKLEPMRREPLVLHRYRLVEIHNTN